MWRVVRCPSHTEEPHHLVKKCPSSFRSCALLTNGKLTGVGTIVTYSLGILVMSISIPFDHLVGGNKSSPGVQFTDNRMTININQGSHLYSTVLYQAARIWKKANDPIITTYRDAHLTRSDGMSDVCPPHQIRGMGDVCSPQQIGPDIQLMLAYSTREHQDRMSGECSSHKIR